MKKQIFKSRIIRFRQFSGKAYAAFQSLHREVTIGRVAAYVAEKEMLKQGKRVAAMAMALLSFGMLYGEETEADAVPLDDLKHLSVQEVLVVSHQAELQSEAFRLVSQISAEEIEGLPIQTVADILQYLPGLDVRTRGANGSQADVSMRGGTFDQVLVMINGVNLNDAQTGHYTLNLPISVSLIDHVEVLQGTSANIFGLNAFSGAINIVTKHSVEDDNCGGIRLSAGMNGFVNPEAYGSWKRSDWQINASAEYSRADGYAAPNPSEKEQKALSNSDFRLANLYLQTTFKGLDLQLGAQYKDAGAGMFYGFGSQDQFDATRTAFGSAKYAHRWGKWALEAQMAYRANYDRYEWHREQRLYGNFHFSQTTAASLKTAYSSKIGKTSFGLELRNENLHSTNLGDTINPAGQVPNVDGFNLADVRVLDLVKGKNRMNVNYFVEQAFYWNNLSASLGVSGNYNTMFGNNFAGGANVGYQFAPASSVYLNANRSLRLPTFTDLYYNAGNQLGNRDLKPEESWTLSLGAKYNKTLAEAGSLHVEADWFYRWGKNIIDWVYTPEDTKRPYHAQNQQQVNSTGVEATVSYHLNDWLRLLSASYAYTYLDLDLKEAGSRYLDYLSHKLTLRLDHGIYVSKDAERVGVLGASWALRYQKREGEYNDANGDVQSYAPVLLLDGSLFWENNRVRVSADCTNLTNRRYYDYGGLLQPGAWAKLTIQAKL